MAALQRPLQGHMARALVGPALSFKRSLGGGPLCRSVGSLFSGQHTIHPVRCKRPLTLCTRGLSATSPASVADAGVDEPVPVEVPPDSLATKEAAMRAGGGRGLLAFYADHQVVPLPPGHRFPMDKYRAMRMQLAADESLEGLLFPHAAPFVSSHELRRVHAQEHRKMRAGMLLDDSLAGRMLVCPAPFVSRLELERVHCPEYLQKVEEGTLSDLEQRAIGFPWSPASVRRSKASCGGTVAATHAVLLGLWPAAATMAGGTHHAFRDRGEGFCIYNDIAVASLTALTEYPHICNRDRPVLVIDLDVHQGNGTAAIFGGSEEVITFSAHGANNYPWRTKMKSTYDVDLPDGMEDAPYLDMVQEWLPFLFAKHCPGLVFFQAGVDALKEDGFGRLSLTRSGLLRRNHMVYSHCIAGGVPLVITMGGGYSRPIDASIMAHADVYRSAAYRYSTVEFTPAELSATQANGLSG